MEQFLAAHALLSTSFRLRRLPSKLQHKLLPIIAQLVDDAELKWFRSDPSANAGVVAVRDALVKEKVLFPGIDYKLAKRQAIADSRFLTFTYKVSNFFNSIFSPFNKKIDLKMNHEKLEYLVSRMDDLGLENATCPSVGSGCETQTTSLVVENIIYGRDEDREMIFNWFTSEINES